MLGEEIAGTQVGQARSEALPRVSANGTYTRVDELQSVDFGGVQMELGTLDSYSAGVGVSQLLYSGGRVGAALRAAQLSRDYAGEARRGAELALVRDIRIAFHGVLLAQERVAVAQASVDHLESLSKETGRKLDAGKASEFDLLSARVRLANEKPVLIAARSALALVRAALARLIMADEPDLAITGRLECVEWNPLPDALAEMALTGRAEILQAESGVELSREAVTASRAGVRPNLGLFANYTGANTYGFTDQGNDLEWHWNAGLALNWPLWDGGLTHHAVREKELDLEMRMVDLGDLKSAVRIEVRQGYLDLTYAREAVSASRDTVQMAEEALKIANARYSSGLSTQLEYADANLALRQARLAYLVALASHMDAMARLEYACGIARPEWGVGMERSAAR